jgi:hypothetical protein
MLGGPHGRASRGHERFWAQHMSDQRRQICREIPMKAFAILGAFLLAFPAFADNPAAPGVHDVPALSQFKDVVTWISASPAPRPGNPCAIRVSIDRELEKFLAAALMEAGYPNAAPAPVYMDPPLNPPPPVTIKPSFSIEATTKLQDSDSFDPTCLLAMQAEVALGGDQRLVLWSSPLVILEADAGSDPGKPSEDLRETFKRMLREMARVFVYAWHGVKEPMYVPN